MSAFCVTFCRRFASKRSQHFSCKIFRAEGKKSARFSCIFLCLLVNPGFLTSDVFIVIYLFYCLCRSGYRFQLHCIIFAFLRSGWLICRFNRRKFSWAYSLSIEVAIAVSKTVIKREPNCDIYAGRIETIHLINKNETKNPLHAIRYFLIIVVEIWSISHIILLRNLTG